MCGILGGSNLKWDYKKSINTMRHRGPDGQKTVQFQDFVFAFSRLAIRDLSKNGMQPMASYDGNVHIVFNGEIYGYEKLRNRLEKKYPFISTSDTEVILYAYMEYGDKFIQHIDGMFGLAIYDKRIQKIKLFRDRVGIKPLYYYFKDGEFAFSSEIKGILNLFPNKKLPLDYTGIYDYFTYHYIPEPKSMYQDIKKLEPAHMLEYDVNQHKIQKIVPYWKLKINSQNGRSKGDTKELQLELKRLLQKSIREQMIADVPVGTLLSGGVDSSIITYESHMLNPEIQAFSMGFSVKQYNELDYAKKLIDSITVKWNNTIFDKEEFNEMYANLSQYIDEPFGDLSLYPTYQLLRYAKKDVSVVLSGDGSDELFGGYKWYLNCKQDLSGSNFNIKKISEVYENLCKRKIIQSSGWKDSLFLDSVSKCAKHHSYGMKRDKKKLAQKWKIGKDYDDYWAIRKYYKKDLPNITAFQYLDFNVFLRSVLTKVDIASMSVSLEARVPFLSREVIEFAFSLSQEERCPNLELKGLLKNTYKEYIPKEILYRKKMGFNMPGSYEKKIKKSQLRCLKKNWNI